MLYAFQEHFKLIILWGIIMALLFGGISLLFPKQYSAETRVLIISRDRSGVDPYTQAKSSERIGENISQLMKTTDFYNKVMSSSTINFDTTLWQNLDERKRREKWEKDVVGAMIYGGSLLQITVYADTKEQAEAFSEVVTKKVVDHGWEYVGGDVFFKQVDNPLVSRLPARPNLIVNSGIGFWVGLVLSGLWIVRYKKHAPFRAR